MVFFPSTIVLLEGYRKVNQTNQSYSGKVITLMQRMTRKSQVTPLLLKSIGAYHSGSVNDCAEVLHREILLAKVKFPLLEYCGRELVQQIPKTDQVGLCDRVEGYKTIGGNVIIGIILQERLQVDFKESIRKATEYISQADAWYVCDIIGERVWGVSMLEEFDKTIPEIKRLAKHESHWVVRSLGAGSHYAIKKGLEKERVAAIFRLLLSMASSNNKEIRQGVGWAAKTTAKFHPDLITHFRKEIEDKEKVANWFRAKIKIGLNRHNYAQGNRS